MNNSQDSPGDITEYLYLLVQIGRLAHSFGVPSERLEGDLQRLAQVADYEGAFQVSPSAITFVLWRPNEIRQHIHVETLPSPGFNLGKLAALSEIIDRTIDQKSPISTCLKELNDLKTAPAIWGEPAVALGYALCGGGFAVVMGLGLQDVAVADTMSFAVYVLGRLSSVCSALGSRFEIACGLLVGALVTLIAHVLGGGSVTATIVAGLVVLLPGYGLTLGTGELATGHISSGFQRLFAAFLTTLKLFVSASIGATLVSLVTTVPDTGSADELNALAKWFAVACPVVGLGFVFQVRRVDLFWILLVAAATYAGMLLGGVIGPWQGSFVGAFFMCICATFSAQRLNRPVTIALVPSLMILVPGATAVLGLQAVKAGGAVAGLTAEWQTLVNIGAILAGLLTARNILPDRVDR